MNIEKPVLSKMSKIFCTTYNNKNHSANPLFKKVGIINPIYFENGVN